MKENGTRKVLLADRDGFYLQRLKRCLERKGEMRVLGMTDSGPALLEMAKEMQPDVILMDIRMPVMDGHQATKAIRTMPDRPDGAVIPIVAMSANAYVEDIECSKAVGMNAHLSKPIKAIEILQAVEDYAAVSS